MGTAAASMEPGSPAPPTDLFTRPLPLQTMAVGTRLFRLTKIAADPLFFGPMPGEPPAGRFDACDGSFRTCYVGLTPEACFAEKFLRLAERALELSFVSKIALARLEVLEPLRLVALHGPGLAQLSATATVVNGPYAGAREWAAALFAHPQRPDGLCWRSRFDDSLLCAAMFDRCARHMRVVTSEPLISQATFLRNMIDRYQIALID